MLPQGRGGDGTAGWSPQEGGPTRLFSPRGRRLKPPQGLTPVHVTLGPAGTPGALIDAASTRCTDTRIGSPGPGAIRIVSCNVLPMTGLRDRLLAEPPNPPPYVLEDMAAADPELIVRALGTDWLATRSAWISIGWLTVLGQIMARVVPGRSRTGPTVAGLGFAGLTGLSMIAHQIGTIAAARSVGAPMRGVVFTATLAYNTYPEEPPLPATVHLLRALGGPAGNLLLGIGALKLHRRHPRIRALTYLGWLNVLFTCAALTPIPTLDGGAAIRAWRQLQGREPRPANTADE